MAPRNPIALGNRDEYASEEVEIKLPVILEEGFSDAPRAGDGDEAPPSGRIVEAPTDGSVLVEGVRIGTDCSVKVINTACASLGLSTRGSKRDSVTRLRLRSFMNNELLAMRSAASTLAAAAEGRRSVVMQKKPNKPTAQRVEAHDLTPAVCSGIRGLV